MVQKKLIGEQVAQCDDQNKKYYNQVAFHRVFWMKKA